MPEKLNVKILILCLLLCLAAGLMPGHVYCANAAGTEGSAKGGGGYAAITADSALYTWGADGEPDRPALEAFCRQYELNSLLRRYYPDAAVAAEPTTGGSPPEPPAPAEAGDPEAPAEAERIRNGK